MSWLPVFDRIRALFARNHVYNADNLLQNQSDLGRFTSIGDFVNQSSSASLLEQTNLHINRLERYKDFDQMDEVGEISLALDLYADEASLVDSERKHSIFIKSKHKKIKEELDSLFFETLLIDINIRSIVRYLCKYGDCSWEIIPTEHRDGVSRIRHLNIYNFNRCETKNGDLVGFFYQDELTASPQFFNPWQIMHLRLTSLENVYHPYGRSILDGARKAFKQLRLMEDAAIIYRLTRAPEKRVFTIPVGNIPTKEIPDVIEMASRAFKKKKIFDYSSNDVTERWSPQIQEDDFWLPQRPGGEGPKIDTLPGAENLDQIADIEYFKKKMIAPLKIPFSRVGMGDKGDDSKQSLSQVAPEFGKAVQFIQSIVSIGLKKIALVHLALRGYSIEEMKSFDIGMTASSAIDELYRIEVWNSRAEVISKLKDIGYFKPEWLVATFTDMSLDEIELLDLNKKTGEEGGGGGGGGGGGLDLGNLGGEPGPGPELDLGAGIEGVDTAAPSLESYNKDEKLIFEQARKIIREEKMSLDRIVTLVRESKQNNAPFDYLLNKGELDGLTQKIDGQDVIVESVIKDAEEIKEVVKKIMKEERSGFKSYEDTLIHNYKDDSKEITIKDIPV